MARLRGSRDTRCCYQPGSRACWGAAKSRPTYARLCAERDRQYDNKMVSLCRELAEEGGYDLDAEAIARGLSAMMEGLWLDVLVGPDMKEKGLNVLKNLEEDRVRVIQLVATRG